MSARDEQSSSPGSGHAEPVNISDRVTWGSQEQPQSHSASVDLEGITRRRRPSVGERLAAIGQAGGVNSFNNFARSWQRAAGFQEVTPSRRSFLIGHDDQATESSFSRTTTDSSPKTQRSMLRAALESRDRRISENPVVDEADAPADESAPLLSSVERRLSERRSSPYGSSIFQTDPRFASPFSGSYGTLSSRAEESHARATARASGQQPSTTGPEATDEGQPLLLKQVENESGKSTLVVVGQSTLPQTIFNSVNTLIGVGMLSLPLAVRYSGWVFGLGFFLFASVVTSYTSKLLAKCLDVDKTLITFADLAYISFGTRARIAISILFCLELVASCVALVILFADSLDALFDDWGVLEFKIVCGFVLIPLVFVPLRYLSFTSVLGILCCLTIVVGVIVDGIVKPEAPGSLRDPAPTYAFPQYWTTLPLAFGLLMAPWGGHAVFPNIYRDMRHPRKYSRAVNVTYIFTFTLELALTVIGYLMFGDDVADEITSNIFKTSGYPRWLSYIIAVVIAIIPLTKLPLNARPIFSTVEFFLGIPLRVDEQDLTRRQIVVRHISKISIRLIIVIVLIVLAILVPSFDRVMALLGSMACSLVCVVLPCAFHQRIFGKDLSWKSKALDWFLILMFAVCGIIGTVFAFIPKALLNGRD